MKLSKAFIFNPSQSRRLIAKAVVKLPQIQHALKNGNIFIGRGSTNAYVLEELYAALNINETFNKGDFVAGQIVPSPTYMKWWINKGNRYPEIILKTGKKHEVKDRTKEVNSFKEHDLIIKGANALDINGIPGVLAGGNGGGTIGSLTGIIQAKGLEVICPLGLEKAIFGNLMEIQQDNLMGMNRMDMPALGIPCGIIPMPYATVITEIEALEFLFECEVFHVASGGVGGSEGSVSLLINAEDEPEMQNIITFLDQIAKEPSYCPNLE
jgi:hypothetical protein